MVGSSLSSREWGSVQWFAEVHTAEAVLLGAVGLGVPVPGVVAEVLGHGFVGLEPDFAEMEAGVEVA